MEPLQLSLLNEVGWVLPLSAVGVLLVTPLIMRVARWMEWVAYPREDRWHGTPTALMGGIAIYVAATLGVCAALPPEEVWPLWGGATLMFVVGGIDDLWGIQPAAKLVAQVIATGLLLYAGYAFGTHWPLWGSFPVTLFWVVGITNAVNLLDNMDGLAAGIAGIAALIMVVFAGFLGSVTAIVVGSAVGGAALGFLAFNFEPARIFMGDCGSLFLGFSIAALALVIQQQAADMGQETIGLIPLAVMAVPILDTTLVMFMRKLAGRPVSKGGKDHTSHRLVFLGLSERHAVLMLYGISLCAGALALLVLFVDVALFYAVSVFVGAALGVFGMQVARADVYEGQEMTSTSTSSRKLVGLLPNAFGHWWKAGGSMLVDVMLVGAAFVVAHYLRYEKGLTAGQDARMMAVLPLVVAAKVLLLYVMGMYRGIWPHAGTPELVRSGGATLLGTGATFGIYGGLYGLQAVPASVLVIDWMIVTLAVIGVRFGFRGLRQYFAVNRDTGRRVLLYGAGDAGVLTLRELRQNPDLDRQPVGFLDDDPSKQQQTVQGLTVYGSGDDLVQVCREYEIDEVIVATTTMSEARRCAVSQKCRKENISCTEFDVTVDPLTPSRSTRRADASALVVSSRVLSLWYTDEDD